MSQIDFVVNQLKCAYDGEAWHGPALMEIIDGIDAKAAAAHPVPTAHSIWELVLHVAAWEQIVTRRIVHGKELTLSDDENFGHIHSANDASWREAIQKLRENHSELIAAVSAMPESRLNDAVPGKDYDIRFMLMGTAQHAAYHGGQIALLKRFLA
jgi:uncharacterized damage-inducible protein DinB